MASAAVAAAVVAAKILRKGEGYLEPVEKGKQRYLIFGKNGWIGGMLQELLTSSGKEFYLAQSRCENRESVKAELLRIKPTHVLNAAGVTGMPNVDWCEFNQVTSDPSLNFRDIDAQTHKFQDEYFGESFREVQF